MRPLLLIASLLTAAPAAALIVGAAPRSACAHTNWQHRRASAISLSETEAPAPSLTETEAPTPSLSETEAPSPDPVEEKSSKPWEKYLRMARDSDSEFLQWVYNEKAREVFEKENPVNPLEVAWQRAQGPLSSLLVITAGFFAIPTIQALLKAAGVEIGGDQ